MLSPETTGNKMPHRAGHISLTANLRNEADYRKLDWNVIRCILEQRRNGIRSFVSQLLDFALCWELNYPNSEREANTEPFLLMWKI